MRGSVLRNTSKIIQSLTRPIVVRRNLWNIRPSLNPAPNTLNPSICLILPREFSTEAEWTDDKFNDIMKNNKMVVFMKGTPDSPMCGFSKHVIQILHMHGCQHFTTFNVLDDDILRGRLKEFSNWPTIPQVYVNGEFIGGFDILLQMHQNGELIEELDKIGHRSALIDAENE